MVFYLSVLNRVYNFVRVCPNVRPMFSTERALLEATNEWLWNIENNLLNGVIFLDLKKALTLLHMELASSENHHKPHNINPRFNNYSI